MCSIIVKDGSEQLRKVKKGSKTARDPIEGTEMTHDLRKATNTINSINIGHLGR